MSVGTGNFDADAWAPELMQCIANNISECVILLEGCEPFRVIWHTTAHAPYCDIVQDGRPWLSIFPTTRERGISDIFRNVLNTGQPFEDPKGEFPRIQGAKRYELTGDTIYCDIKVLPVKRSGNSDINLMVILRDITEAKELERSEKLAARERDRLQVVIETIPSGIALIEKPDGRLTLINRRAEELYGQRIALHAPIWDLFRGFKIMRPSGKTFSTEELPGYRALFRGENVRNEEVFSERPDGSHMSVMMNAVPLRNESGEVIAAVIDFEDVTSLKEAQEVLKKALANVDCARKRLETIIETIPVAVVIAEGAEGRVSLMNLRAEELLGRQPAIGLPMSDHATYYRLLRPDNSLYDSLELPLSRALREGVSVKGVEITIEHPDGKRITTLNNSTPMIDEDGRITGAVVSFEDITLLKQTQETLRIAYNQELRVSQTLQQALLPKVPSHLDGIRLESAYRAAYAEAHVGGDFFDVFLPEPGKVGIVIGDVSGKGVGAAVRTALIKYTLRGYALENAEPSTVLERLNNAVAREQDMEEFVTLFYGLLDLNERTLVFANAGHEPPYCLVGANRKIIELKANGTVIGVLPGASYGQRRVQLDRGDKILMYTDGLTDARDGHRFFGHNRIKATLEATADNPAYETIPHLLKKVMDFSNGQLKDDIAMLLLCVE